MIRHAHLTIKENTRVYFHKNAVLWVYRDGTLKVEGELGNPVTFQGDRLENLTMMYPDNGVRYGYLKAEITILIMLLLRTVL